MVANSWLGFSKAEGARVVSVETKYKIAWKRLGEVLKAWEDADGPNVNGRKAISQELADSIEDAINLTADEKIEGDSVTVQPVAEDSFEASLLFDQLATAYRDFKRRACAALSVTEIEVDGDQALWRAVYSIKEWAVTKYNYQPPSPIPVLRSQGVGDEQIARIYGWTTEDNQPDLSKVLEEEAKAGTHYSQKGWVHPAKRKRIESARAAVSARVPRRREYVRESEYGRTIPPTIEELVKMNAPAPQIAMLHKMDIEDVEALLKAAGHVEAGSDPGETNLVRDTAAEVEKTSKQKK
jgi:hypothetical protein